MRPATANSGCACAAAAKREDVPGEQIAGVEEHEAGRELVDDGEAGGDRGALERGRRDPHQRGRDREAAGELGHHEEDRQEIDEPERAERLPERFEIEPGQAGEAMLLRQHRRLEGELQRGPQQIEVDEMHDLAVQIGAPVAVDDQRQEQARDQEEIRHPERPREGHYRVQPAFLPDRLLDPERRMHHHHEDDAEAFGIVHPVDPPGRRIAACALRLRRHGVAGVLVLGIALVAHGRPCHFGSHSSHIRIDRLRLPLPIQLKCQGGA